MAADALRRSVYAASELKQAEEGTDGARLRGQLPQAAAAHPLRWMMAATNRLSPEARKNWFSKLRSRTSPSGQK